MATTATATPLFTKPVFIRSYRRIISRKFSTHGGIEIDLSTELGELLHVDVLAGDVVCVQYSHHVSDHPGSAADV